MGPRETENNVYSKGYHHLRKEVYRVGKKSQAMDTNFSCLQSDNSYTEHQKGKLEGYTVSLCKVGPTT